MAKADTLTGDVVDRSIVPANSVLQKSQFLAIQQGIEGFTDVMEEIAPGRTPRLPRTGIPSGGGRSWEVVAGDNVLQTTPTIPAIILYKAYTRHYYASSFAESGGGPPTCWSPNRKQGYGDPGIECARCKLGQWHQEGSGQNRKRIPPPCNATALLYLLTPYSTWPVRVTLPSTSAAIFEKYVEGLLMRGDGSKTYSVVTDFGLESVQGISTKYSRLKLSLNHPLVPEESEAVRKLRQMFLPMFESELDPNRFLAAQEAVESDSSVTGAIDIPSDEVYDREGLAEI